MWNWADPDWVDHVRETKPYSQALDRIVQEDKLEAQLARKRRNAKIARAAQDGISVNS
jgi:heme oxygenase